MGIIKGPSKRYKVVFSLYEHVFMFTFFNFSTPLSFLRGWFGFFTLFQSFEISFNVEFELKKNYMSIQKDDVVLCLSAGFVCL